MSRIKVKSISEAERKNASSAGCKRKFNSFPLVVIFFFGLKKQPRCAIIRQGCYSYRWCGYERCTTAERGKTLF